MGYALKLIAAIAAAAPACLSPALARTAVHAPTVARTEAVFPFLFEDGRLYVPVAIRGSAPLWFILDTGATRTVIDSAVAARMGIGASGDEEVTGAGPGSLHQAQAAATRLIVGTMPLDVAAPAVADLARLLGPTGGRAPAGIIGSQLFREHFVLIDFRRRQISLLPPSGRPAGFEASVPLTFDHFTPRAPVLLTLPSGRRMRADSVVDLGAKSTLLLAEPFIARAHLRSEFAATVTMGLGAGVGGATHYAFARAHRIAFAAAPRLALAAPVVGLSVGGTLKSADYDGLIGADFLSHFRLGVDYAGSRLLLTRVGTVAAGFDMSGLFLVASGPDLKRLEVREVVAGGPGAKAGLAAGDEIVSLDGRPAAAVGLAAARRMLKSKPGRIVALAYRRGGERRTAVLRLESQL